MDKAVVNWAGNIAYGARAIHFPRTVGELQEIVATSGKVRALGSRHSFNRIADTTGDLVSLTHLNRILSVDEDGTAVTVEGGITYGQLGPALHAAGFGLHNLASLPHIGVVGAVSTATHGSGERNGNLATAIRALTLVTATGDLVTLRRGEAEFDGAVVSLGALGVVSSITLDLQPFPGTLAVGIDPNDPSPRKGGVSDPMAPVSTLRPWKNGSNMDINEMKEGSTVFYPVFLKGGLIWMGDSHCRQGNGEVNLTALECSYKEIRIQPIVRKDMKLDWPFIETRTHWITVGVNEDLNVAMTNAVREAVNWLSSQKLVPMDRYEAYSLVSMAADCRVSQVVDVRKGVHCMIPKSIFTKRT